jgi:hypothetical protein
MRRGLGCLVVLVFAGLFASAASARVLRVGTYHHVFGTYTTIQAAVTAAHRGDWILVAPGDYKERADHRANRGPQPASTPAGLVINKANLRLRGMNRNTVIVDGTKPGSRACSTKKSAQDFGPAGAAGKGPLGRNGILIWKAANVSVQNLTVCNFLGGSGDVGNEIWWNGGDGSGKVGGYGFNGSYLSATSSFFKDEATAAKYGIFSSNWSGGTWDATYASNFNDSGYYIGACKQICNQTMTRAHAQYNALGYSGSNSGGRLLVKNSEFDHNKDGFDTNSQNGDDPSPQNGACPAGVKPPVAGAPTCWVFTHNYVHDNNNPNVPFAGTAGAGPVGTGISLSGARNDTVMNNRFVRNNAWGVIVVPFTDNGPPCTGGTLNSPLLGQGSCLFDEWGIHVINNSFTANGAYGNPTNGQFDHLNLEAHPSSCFSGNTDTQGALSPDSASLEAKYPTCSTASVPPNINVPFLNEVLCDSQVTLSGFGCAPTDHYPRRTRVLMPKLARQATMPNPCKGVPANPWCPARKHA